MAHPDSTDRSFAENALSSWREQEKKAVQLLKVAGDLRFDRSTELVIFRHDVYDCRPSKLLNTHLVAARKYVGKAIPIDLTLFLAEGILGMVNLPPAKIDVGKLAMEWIEEGYSDDRLHEFLNAKLSVTLQAGQQPDSEGRDVVLYGFGRIGRLVARRIIATTGSGDQLRLKAIVLRPKMKDRQAEAHKRAALLQDDSIHGAFHGTVEVSDGGSHLLINGNPVHLIFAGSPSEIDYTQYGIRNALLIDNTGVWRDNESLQIHKRPGISQVLLTAPGKGIPNIVYGVNQEDLRASPTHDIFCAASCTTNAIVPILKVIDAQYGIEKGHIETVHSYTSDQNLLDNFHKKPRRGRAAAINMVLTSTGAASAVAKVLPGLAGKLTGNAVRVPTPNVSLAIMNLSVRKATSVDDLNESLRRAALYGDLVEQIHFSTSDEYVSSHAVGMTTTSVLDAPSTIVSNDGKTITLYAWYDNEFGYTCQVVRLAKFAANVRRFSYY